MKRYARRLRDWLLRPVREERARDREEHARDREDIERRLVHHVSVLDELGRNITALQERWLASEARLADHIESAGRQREEDRARQAAGEAGMADRLATAEMLLFDLIAATRVGPPVPPAPSAAPAVSVVLATWNRADLVGEAIRSVQAQSWADWELLVVDDGSTDGTADVVRPFLADPRIRLSVVAHGGAARARNHGLDIARAPIVAYVDSDNLMLPRHLEAVVGALTPDADLDLVYGALVYQSDRTGPRVLWQEFDHAALLRGNFVDIGTVAHRRSLYARQGGFDPALTRLGDWDLVLRYTRQGRARRIAVASVLYREVAPNRMTVEMPYWINAFAVTRKHLPPPPPRRPRVLYVVWHYPQLTEEYIEVEIRAARRLGVDVTLWSREDVAVSYPTDTPWRRGTLADALREVSPDVVHVHWVNIALDHMDELAAHEVPVTVRAHGFETTAGSVAALLRTPLHRLYLFPRQVTGELAGDARVRAMPAVFDTSYQRPSIAKDPRLVVRVAAALPSKDLEFFIDLAKRLPEHRFVLALGTALLREEVPRQLEAFARECGSPVDIRFNISHRECRELLDQAAIYLHTAVPPGAPGHTPIGMPISIANAMASGCHVLVRDLPPLVEYVGDAGAAYRDAAEAEALIRATQTWGETDWRHARVRSLDRAYRDHADETTLMPMIEDWRAIAAARG